MYDVTSVTSANQNLAAILNRAAAGSQPRRDLDSSSTAGRRDQVDLSDAARSAGSGASAAERARIASLREQIARGTYLTPEKIEATVDLVYEELIESQSAALL